PEVLLRECGPGGVPLPLLRTPLRAAALGFGRSKVMPLTEGYPHPELLESAAWLAEHLKDPDVRILDAQEFGPEPRGPREYEQGHIPGAILIPGPPFKTPGSGEPCSAADFARIAGEWGIKATDTVICYDLHGRAGTRVWWGFARFGHAKVRYLHGGLHAWRSAGYPVETGVTALPPAVYQPGRPRDELACSLTEAVAALGREGVVFWDSRAEDEYSGVHPNTPAARAGHIPGAVHLEWNEIFDVADGRHYKVAAGQYKP